MASTLPATMRSLCVHSFLPPSKYEISSIATPKIRLPNHVLVKVHAASLNPADMDLASGKFRIFLSSTFPIKIGFDLSGTVAAIADGVKSLKVGDEVFGCLPIEDMGSISQYVLTTDIFLVQKPKSLSHVEAASIPLVAMTAVQAFNKVNGGLEGKSVLVTAGLGGVGSLACQIAKKGYGAARIITTVSTEKVGKVDGLLGNAIVDQVVDYQKSDPLTELRHGSVDVLLNTTGVAISYLPLLSKSKGAIVSPNGLPSGRNAKNVIPSVPLWGQIIFNIIDAYFKFRIQFLGGVLYENILQKPCKKDLQLIVTWVEEGKLRPVVGETLKLEDIEGLRAVYARMETGKGGIGKVVVEID